MFNKILITKNVLVWLLCSLFAFTAQVVLADGSSPGRAVIAWISVDGVRPDYIDRVSTPFFDKIKREGAFSHELEPVFPSLTFPSHASQATGVTVDRHGIPLNSFYDAKRNRSYFYPGFASLLEAEPIWNTAQRQGLRTVVSDWVMSFYQRGRHASTYFGKSFDGNLTDKQRLELLLDVWQKDRGRRNPYQLIMGYMIATDSIGHEYGPDSGEVDAAMVQVDAELSWFAEEAVRIFTNRMNPSDALYLIITTDHGMSAVHSVAHPAYLAGLKSEDEKIVHVIAGGNIAHYFFNKIKDDDELEHYRNLIMKELKSRDFLQAYERDDLPERWGYSHPSRVGDIVAVLNTGYAFSRRASKAVVPVEETGGPLGMHGYDPADDPNMLGIMYVWRYPEPLGGVDLGRVHSLQLHATVAGLLGINPALDARTDPVVFNP
ncbi:MAG TPA: alkaline phosphatase family protein [Kiritimatiellia bacterium]|nr:alkaline phosphatase family protein [Kiritimatiellia bacterium]